MTNVWTARFNEMGAHVTERWRARHRDEAAFPEIAQRILEDAAFGKSTPQGDDFAGLALEVLATDPLPSQTDPGAVFGQPPLTTFRGEGFYIEALFWVDALVTIHQHSFSGAFSVFCGSSIHCRYRFAEKSRVNAAMRFGALDLVDAELLAPGDIRPILSGPSLLHSTFHLERPTVTMIVRTESEREYGPQFDYLPPSLALDPQSRPHVTKRLQLLTMLRRSRPDDYWRAAEAYLARSDFHAAYLVLDNGWRAFADEDDRARLFALARAAHGEALDPLLPVLDTSAKKRASVARRDAVTNDEELRFVLAILTNVPKREVIFDLLRKRFDSPPTEVLLRSLRKLDFDEATLALAKILMTGASDRDALKRALAEANVGFANDYALLTSVRLLREAAGFGALFAATTG